MAWLAIAQGAGGTSVFVAGIIRGRYLPLADFGLYALAMTLMTVCAILADFGTSFTMTKDLSHQAVRPRAYIEAAITLTFAIGVVAAVLLIAAGPLVARDSDILVVTSVLAGSLVLNATATPLTAYLRATGRTSIEAASRTTMGVTLVGGSAIVALVGGGVLLFALATLASSAIAILPSLIVVIRQIGGLHPRVDLERWRAFARAAAPVGSAMLLTSVYYYADSIMLGMMGDREALGLYTAAYTFVFGYTLLIPALRMAFLPAQARSFGDFGPSPRRLYLAMTAVASLPLLLVAPVLPRTLLTVTYGPGFADAGPTLTVLLVTAAVMLFSSMFSSELLVAERHAMYLKATGAGAIVNVVLNLALIPTFGIVGAATATLIAESVVCVAVVLALRTVVRRRPAS